MNMSYIVKRLLLGLAPAPVRRMYSVRKFMRDGYHKEMWGGGVYKDNLEKALSANLSQDFLDNPAYIKKLREDIVSCYIELGATPEEYFAFGFEGMPKSQREKFLTNKFKDIMLLTKVKEEYISRLKDKYTLYQLLSEYFKRDVCPIRFDEDRQLFDEFLRNNPRYFAKQIDGQCGKKADVLEGNQFERLLNEGKWILEQIIEQDEILAQFNRTSVNTVRLPAFLIDGNFYPVGPFFRTGRRGSIVDNGGAGGVFAAIDAETGLIISDGFDENNNSYECHPDSSVKFKGFQIPKWDELINLASQAHRKVPENRYVAWDLALTPKGWVLVEANGMGQFLWQYATKTGLKDQFVNMMSR